MFPEKTCPECGEEFIWDDFKDARRYVRHLENHFGEE